MTDLVDKDFEKWLSCWLPTQVRETHCAKRVDFDYYISRIERMGGSNLAGGKVFAKIKKTPMVLTDFPLPCTHADYMPAKFYPDCILDTL